MRASTRHLTGEMRPHHRRQDSNAPEVAQIGGDFFFFFGSYQHDVVGREIPLRFAHFFLETYILHLPLLEHL